MKCLAEQALRGKRERDRGAEYGLVCLEFIDVSVSRQMMRQHGWRRMRLQQMYDDERHYLSDYIERYAADGGSVKDRHKGFRTLTEGEILLNAIEVTQEKIDQELAAIGFVYDPDDLVPEGFRNTWKRKDLAKSATRMMWYAQWRTGGTVVLYLSVDVSARQRRIRQGSVAEAVRTGGGGSAVVYTEVLRRDGRLRRGNQEKD